MIEPVVDPEQLCSFVAINKPAGLSSARVVARLRNLYGRPSCGHSGTLDPAATGVLVMALGLATRLLPFLLPIKRYRATVRFGVCTPTMDLEGEIHKRRPVPANLRGLLISLLPSFCGEISQVAPAYSALKHAGRPLYDYARKGLAVPIKTRRVTIHSLAIVEQLAADEMVFDVSCGPGTYIRSLASDLGAGLGCGAVLADLVRTENHGIELAHTALLPPVGGSPPPLLEAVKVLAHLPIARIDRQQGEYLVAGRAVPYRIGDDGPTLVMDVDGSVLGIGQAGAGWLRPLRMMPNQSASARRKPH